MEDIIGMSLMGRDFREREKEGRGMSVRAHGLKRETKSECVNF